MNILAPNAPPTNLTVPQADASAVPPAAYWNDVASDWQRPGDPHAWRLLSDAVNIKLLQAWLPPNPGGRALKTDLFDEAVSDGLVPWLSRSFASVAGIDVSLPLVEAARARFAQLSAEVADVRTLPFPDDTFDAVVSNSTLDHFPCHDDIGVAVRELHRVMRAGGTLLVTVDNPLNPVIAIRNALPERLREASGLVPFRVGATCGPRALRALLDEAGFEVVKIGAVFHAPRVLVVLGGHVIDRWSGTAGRRRYASLWAGSEALASLPTTYLTGHFISALARKRSA